jgi:hypothetical protein
LILILILGAGNIWLALANRTFKSNDLSGIIFVTGIVIVGSLVIVRQPQNRMGILFCAVGMLWAASNTLFAYVDYAITRVSSSDILPWLALAGSWGGNLSWGVSATFLFLLFPDGKLPSPRWRIPAIAVASVIVIGLVSGLVMPGPLSQMPVIDNPLGNTSLAPLAALASQLELPFIASVLTCLTSIFIRFRQANALVRRQIKWVAYLGLVLAILYLAQTLVPMLLAESILSAILDASGALLFGAFPLVVGIAILRHQLFDIDVLIRRTLQYTLLTGLLGLLYFGSVTVLQDLFTALGGSQTTAATVISTLAIAAIFNPLRRRLQAFIDRNFYRQKYNAEQVLAGLAAMARSEVEFEKLAASLMEVVQETIQPNGISLWLKVTDDQHTARGVR